MEESAEDCCAVDYLLERYRLTVEDCSREVSDSHLDDISRYYSRDWKSLPPYLDIDRMVVEDTKHIFGDREKRLEFFLQWKQIKGSDATYLQLVSALLSIKCRRDAEGVCKLLQSSVAAEAGGKTGLLTTSSYHYTRF